MRIDEITKINEATAEGVDVINIAQYVAEFLSKHARYGKGYDIDDMENISPLPEINTEAAYSMLYDHGLTFSILKGIMINKNVRNMGAYLKSHRLIWVDQRALTRFGLLTSILAHEIQHALDDIRSAGKALPKHGPNDNRSVYLARPQEINARFSQVMHDIVDRQALFVQEHGQPWDRKKTDEMIGEILRKHDLTRQVFPTGTRGNKAYNRIVSRAHTFNDDVKNFIKPSKDPRRTSMLEKIKLLIRSYLPI